MKSFLLFHSVAIVILILANGFFVAAELALVSVRSTRVEQMIQSGDARALLVRKLQDNLGDFLPVVQLGVTLCSLALGWMGEPFVADLLHRWISGFPDARLYGQVLALALGFICITYFQVLLGELVPKALALYRTDRLVLAIAGPMDFFIRLTRPIVRGMNGSARLVLRAFGAPLAHPAGVHSPEEMMLMATAARRMGVLPEIEEMLIHRTLEMENVIVREIMTPRQQVFALSSDLPIEQASAQIVVEMHSRIPVYDVERGPDAIIGVVYAKDVARLMHYRAHSLASRANSLLSTNSLRSTMVLRQVMRETLFVPETKPVLDLLRELQQQRRHLAVVVDEFGSTSGIVTVEDAIEQLIGEVEDEFDTAPASLWMGASHEAVLDGSVSLRDLEIQLNWELPREGGVETLAGFMLAQMGKIPEVGESLLYDGHRFTVIEREGHRIRRIRIEELDRRPGSQEGGPEA